MEEGRDLRRQPDQLSQSWQSVERHTLQPDDSHSQIMVYFEVEVSHNTGWLELAP